MFSAGLDAAQSFLEIWIIQSRLGRHSVQIDVFICALFRHFRHTNLRHLCAGCRGASQNWSRFMDLLVVVDNVYIIRKQEVLLQHTIYTLVLSFSLVYGVRHRAIALYGMSLQCMRRNGVWITQSTLHIYL
jgi:hypothetical protein